MALCARLGGSAETGCEQRIVPREELGFSGLNQSRVIDVAAAVILKPNGDVLLGQRPSGKPYAGYWEFPGGKIEPDETAHEALLRELDEELGIRVARADPWLTRTYRYAHATVRLRFFRVSKWDGEIYAREHVALAWQSASSIGVAPLLPANQLVLDALRLPDFYAITPDRQFRSDDFLIQLDRALRDGLRLLQVRDKSASVVEFKAFAREAVTLCRAHKTKVMLNSDIQLAEKLDANGVQLTSAQLMALTERPSLELCGASCHDARGLERAIKLNLDFVVLGSVFPTASHPGAPSLGWQQFSDLIGDYPLPVYAIGGLQSGDLQTAKRHGAHGIAMIRGAWHRDSGGNHWRFGAES
ncbi:MAG: Nudix family hydrolase [Burkholderiales bacterium]|nr:Nudix family hydrolase [Burkholderiales bacterium]